jgi:DNA-binding NarL/FixJ family response regulator
MTLKVFLVEDLHAMRDLITDACSRIGGFHIAGWAGSEPEARFWLDENPEGWDIAIVDLVLAQGSGVGVVSHAKRQPGAGKVVVFSSYATPGVREKCFSVGADAVFDKNDTFAFLSWLAGLVNAP